MGCFRFWTIVISILFLSSTASAQIFPFMTCTESGDADAVSCKFCLASSAQGSNKVCSRSYNTNPGANDPTPGFSNISKELTDDLTNKLVKIKEFPEEGFQVKDFRYPFLFCYFLNFPSKI